MCVGGLGGVAGRYLPNLEKDFQLSNLEEHSGSESKTSSGLNKLCFRWGQKLMSF